MNIFQIAYIAIASHLVSFGIFYFLYSVFVYRRKGKYLYFSIATLLGTVYMMSSYYLSIPTTPDAVVFIHKMKMASIILIGPFWLLCAYDIFFEDIRIPKLFLKLSLFLYLFFLPGNMVLTKPVNILNFKVLGIPYFYQFASSAIGYKITAVFILIIFVFSLFKALLTKMTTGKKILSFFMFTPAIIGGIHDFNVIYRNLEHPLITEFLIFGFLISTFILFMLENREDFGRLLNIKEELRIEVDKRTNQLEAAHIQVWESYKNLKQANNIRTEMLEMAAHDMKNPLQAVSGYAELLMIKLKHDLSLKRMAKKIRESSEHMLKMINALLEVEIERTGDIELNKSIFDLAKAVDFVSDRNFKLAFDKQQHLKTRIPSSLMFWGDRGRIIDIFENLISNAIKYSPQGSSIEINLEGYKTYIVFSVTDYGPGLSEEDQSKLFNKYQRLTPKPTGGEKSTGLGLFTAKRFISLHEGDIKVQSILDQGTTFTVTLPIQSPSEKENTQPETIQETV